MPQLPTTTVVTPCELGQHARRADDVGVVVRVHVDETRRQRQAVAVDHVPRLGAGQLADGRDASAFQRHAGAVFGLAAAVQHAHVAYESVKHLLFQVQSPSGSRFGPPR